MLLYQVILISEKKTYKVNRRLCIILGFISLFPPQIMHVFGPQHTATINGLMKSTAVRSPNECLVLLIQRTSSYSDGQQCSSNPLCLSHLWNGRLHVDVHHSGELGNRRSDETQLSNLIMNLWINNKALFAGSILSYFYPDGITSEDFRDRFQDHEALDKNWVKIENKPFFSHSILLFIMAHLRLVTSSYRGI